jgi:uroporphyrinogen decarboxylase
MLRGFNNALMDPYLCPDRFVQLRDLIIEFNLASIREQLGLGVDGIYFSDDWGTQRALLMNPDDWRKWYKPQYKRMFDAVHEGGAHAWMHLCGNVTSIIPDLIEIGLNVLNPVQPQAMDVNALADEFGGRLCFFGGVDVQGTLPHGTTLDVEREARHLINILGRYSGGYIGSTSHTILPDTPLENIVALFRTFREYSGA